MDHALRVHGASLHEVAANEADSVPFLVGQRVPLLVRDGLAAPFPMLVPFIYVKLTLTHRAYNTAAAHLHAIQVYYTSAKSRDLDIYDAILDCHFEAILALLDGYALWLQIERPARVGSLGPT